MILALGFRLDIHMSPVQLIKVCNVGVATQCGRFNRRYESGRYASPPVASVKLSHGFRQWKDLLSVIE